MKLASLKGGRDGRLVVVSEDLAWYAPADTVAPTLQAALDEWERCEPQLRALAATLEHGGVPRERFHEHAAASPLPRAYQWLYASAEGARREPSLQRGASDGFLGPRDPLALADAAGLELAPGLAVITGDAPQGVAPDAALGAIRLVMLCNAVAPRHLAPGEAATETGFFPASPGAAFSPVAATSDSLQGWRAGKLQGRLEVELNGEPLAGAETGADMARDFGTLIAHAARPRALSAGSIIGCGLATPVDLKAGDVVRIEMRDARRHTIFGAIEHQATRP